MKKRLKYPLLFNSFNKYRKKTEFFVGSTKFKIQSVVNLFEDTGSVLRRPKNFSRHFL
jgi:hypothetical protein